MTSSTTTRITLSPFGASDLYAEFRAHLTASGLPAVEGPAWYIIDVVADYDDVVEYMEEEGFDLSEVLVEKI